MRYLGWRQAKAPAQCGNPEATTDPSRMWSIYVVVPCALLVGLALLAGLWLLLGPGPVRTRTLNRARRALDNGDWQSALTTVVSLHNDHLPPLWQERLRNLNGGARQAAADAALKDKNYEAALEHSLKAASVLGTPEADARAAVVGAMLAEARRQFAGGVGGTDAVLGLTARILTLQTPCPEALFWKALVIIVKARSILRWLC